MRQFCVLILCALAAGLSLSAMSSVSAQESGDAAAVRQIVMHTFDKPGEALSLDPVVVEADAAIVGWVQGDLAGRAFLRRTQGNWAIVACGGDALKSPDRLQALGLDRTQAGILAGRLASAEKALAPKRVALFSSFDGVIVMGAGGEASGHHGKH